MEDHAMSRHQRADTLTGPFLHQVKELTPFNHLQAGVR